MAALAEARALAASLSLSPTEAARHGLALRKDGQRRTAFELLAYPDIGIARARAESGRRSARWSRRSPNSSKSMRNTHVYLERQAADVESYRRDENLALPDDIDYAAAAGPFQRSAPEARAASAAHHRSGRPARRHHAGGTDHPSGALAPARPEARRRGMSATGSGGAGPDDGSSPQSAPARSEDPADLHADRERCLALTPVSRETLGRLDRFVALLLDWQQRMNLIAPSTGPIDLDPARRRFAPASAAAPARPASGSIWARAADFRAWSSPARSRTCPERMCTWSKACAKRRLSCARPCANSACRPSFTPIASRNSSANIAGTHRRCDRPGGGAACRMLAEACRC